MSDVWVTLTISDTPDPFVLPEVGLKVPVALTFVGPGWTAVHHAAPGITWTGEGETQTAAILSLLARRLGE